jgi:hypothetical protein
MFQLEDIKIYHIMHNQFQDAVDQIIQFYNEINDRDDEIENIRSAHDGFSVEVYQWVGGGYQDSNTINISFDLLTNEELFNHLAQQADDARTKRERLKEEREYEKKNKQIEEAMKFLKDNGKL